MDINFNCEKCGKPLAIEALGAGTMVKCPSCQQPIHVPKPAPAPPRPLPKPPTPVHPPTTIHPPQSGPKLVTTPAPAPAKQAVVDHPIIAPPPSAHKPSQVIVTDIRWPFWSMVGFMIKWTLASIPALFILSGLIIGLVALLGGLLGGLLGSGNLLGNNPPAP